MSQDLQCYFLLLGTQALPAHHYWRGIQENPVADPSYIDLMTKLYPTRSGFTTDRIISPQDDVIESARYNGGTSMILDSYPEVPPKYPYSGNISTYPFSSLDDTRFISNNRPNLFTRFIGESNYLTENQPVSAQPELFSTPRSIAYQPEYVTEKTKSCLSSHNDLLSKVRAIEKALQELTSAITCNEDEVTSKTPTTSPSPPVLIEATVKSNTETIKSSEKRVTTSKPATSTTFRAQPLFPIELDVAIELEHDKSSEEKEEPLDTKTTTPSAPRLVPTEPNAAFELNSNEIDEIGKAF